MIDLVVQYMRGALNQRLDLVVLGEAPSVTVSVIKTFPQVLFTALLPPVMPLTQQLAPVCPLARALSVPIGRSE